MGAFTTNLQQARAAVCGSRAPGGKLITVPTPDGYAAFAVATADRPPPSGAPLPAGSALSLGTTFRQAAGAAHKRCWRVLQRPR